MVMAHALTSNSFFLTSSHNFPPLTRKHNRSPPTVVTAAASKPGFSFPSFKIGKSEEPVNDSAKDGNSQKKRGVNFFNIGKLVPDNVQSLVPLRQSAFGVDRRSKDGRTVFVAGATGQSGVRITQTLLRQGYAVRAVVPDLNFAQELARIAALYKIISTEEFKRLNAVESTLQDATSVAKAIGNASKVVVAVGPGENGANAELSAREALKVIEASELAGVQHVIIIYESGFNTMSTYNILDGLSSFFNNIFSKEQPLSLQEFMAKVVETNVRYTLIKAKLADDYAEERSYNLVVAREGETGANDYKVCKTQITSLVADVFEDTAIAENKVVEVSTSPLATRKTIRELFSAIPEDGRRNVYAEAIAKAKAEKEALEALKKAAAAAEATKKLEQEVKKLSQQEARESVLAEEAMEKAEAAVSNLDALLDRAKAVGQDFSWEKLSSQIANAIPAKPQEKPKVQLATIRGQAKARTLTPRKAVIKQTSQSKQKQTEVKNSKKQPEMRPIFGGLFNQETIYIDDD